MSRLRDRQKARVGKEDGKGVVGSSCGHERQGLSLSPGCQGIPDGGDSQEGETWVLVCVRGVCTGAGGQIVGGHRWGRDVCCECGRPGRQGRGRGPGLGGVTMG